MDSRNLLSGEMLREFEASLAWMREPPLLQILLLCIWNDSRNTGRGRVFQWAPFSLTPPLGSE